MLDEQDEKTIEETMRALGAAFRERNAELARGVYVDDADWTNAFGTRLKGREAIVDYLAGLFAAPQFAAGKMKGPPQAALRVISHDVVAVSTYTEILGQQTSDGGVLDTRRNHSLKVLARQPDGRWLIETEMYMDARTDETYRAG